MLWDQAAEKALLGAALIQSTVIDEVSDVVLDVDFYTERHRILWGRCVALHQAGEPLDPITVSGSFKDERMAAQAGGISYLTQLQDMVPRIDNAPAYARQVADLATRRRMQDLGRSLLEDTAQSETPTPELLEGLQAQALSLLTKQSPSIALVGSCLTQAVARLEAVHDGTASLGLSTGFKGLDKLLGGLQSPDLLILAARPSMGKTAFALNIGALVAKAPATVALFSMEMSKAQLTTRLLLSEARVSKARLDAGKLGEHEWHRLMEAAKRLYELPIYIDDTPALSLPQLRSTCRRLQAQSGLDLVIVDYLQLMRSGEGQAFREQEIAAISRGLKTMAMELDVPVIALSQLNRALEARPIEQRRPIMSDLRESGAIEQDADVIMFIYREAVYRATGDTRLEDLPLEVQRKAELIIRKQRNGPIGTVPLFFRGEYTRFENIGLTPSL